MRIQDCIRCQENDVKRSVDEFIEKAKKLGLRTEHGSQILLPEREVIIDIEVEWKE